MIIILTGKWRKALAHYCIEHDLAHAGKGVGENGWSNVSNAPFKKPGRHVIKRVQDNMVALKLLDKKYADGTLNAATQKLLIPPKPKLTFGEKVAKTAITQSGVTEDPWGSNDGAKVRQYQAITGAYRAAWCASFVSWCLWQNGYRGAVTAGAKAWANIGSPVRVENALPGDVVSLNIGEGHVGIFLNREGNDVKLISGNHNQSVGESLYPISEIHSITRQAI